MQKNKKIILVGGGTGGHIFPLVNLVHFLRKSNTDILFHWIGEANSIESKVTTEEQIPFSPIICGKLRRYFSFQTLLVPFQVLIGIFQSVLILIHEKPKAIFSKGGYVSLPIAIAGWILRIPVYLHESDSISGLANRIVGRFATGIFCAFDEVDNYFKKSKILGHGSLLSQETAEIANGDISLNARTQTLVSCGSQGSASIFDAILELLPIFPDVDFHIILGVKNLDYRTKFEKFPNVKIFDFFYNQGDYLRIVQKCDIAIARSGSSIFEFEAFGLHMILIPHPFTGNNHQYWNAKAFEKKGHEILEQKNINELEDILTKYQTFKKSGEKRVVDMSIFDTIAQTLFQ
ncbi:glycosyltransferase [Candidatus Gracilibacteria bacterium]|nr:glycosyltransferase [Candidatus Gracilibacteria bacterium]